MDMENTLIPMAKCSKVNGEMELEMEKELLRMKVDKYLKENG